MHPPLGITLIKFTQRVTTNLHEQICWVDKPTEPRCDESMNSQETTLHQSSYQNAKLGAL